MKYILLHGHDSYHLESNREFTTIDRELEEPFITAKKKRVFVSTSRDILMRNRWHFEIPLRSYEVWTLLCWSDETRALYDFPVPQKTFSSDFAMARRVKKDGKIPVQIDRTEEGKFTLTIAAREVADISAFQGDYAPLK